MATSAIGKLCADTLFEYGLSAVEAVKRTEVNDALENIVEANTLLSGMGFESGGLAVAHSIAQGLTVVPEVHRNYMHGEMVAIGLLTQLVLEKNVDEARKVAGFFANVGLPVHLGQISLSLDNEAQIRGVMEAAMMLPFVANEPFAASTESLITAAAQAHELGLDVSQSTGDVPYRALHWN